ncbi:protein AMN1-like protein [Cucumis melo var. makuwa]|uniref:Protein AMN1-like protein n=1 Tax=Cucumis melo var. makuwa TaxID=1194695 RepID=A0A5D3DI95_CUCMM|nr:protein AMN1-like protein [Cucumis melo var. makuwa]TYK23110.1 protein AMN1-like protein [Cucumis melo var. makuwa]
METIEEAKNIAKTFVKFDLNQKSSSQPTYSNTFVKSASPDLDQKSCFKPTASQFSRLAFERKKPPNLVSLCVGVIGKHLEDIIPDLDEISANFPSDVKQSIAAVARRRELLNDDVIISLVDSSWETLDVSGSEVSDFGLAEIGKTCKSLRAVDISRCNKITAAGVSELVQHCCSLETLRCGGCPRSDATARRSLDIFKPRLDDIEGDSWEELDTAEIANGAQSLRWLVWPKIDKDSLEIFSTECPRITINPKPSPFGFRGKQVPGEALPNIALDEHTIVDIDPKTWAVGRSTGRAPISPSNPSELSLAEKFRLAFVERDTRLAPKRAKNARQHQRRAEREWMTTSTRAKALALASQASKSLQSRT